MDATFSLEKRSGLYSPGSCQTSGLWCKLQNAAVQWVPAGRVWPSIVTGFAVIRAIKGTGAWSLIPSFTHCVRYSSFGTSSLKQKNPNLLNDWTPDLVNYSEHSFINTTIVTHSTVKLCSKFWSLSKFEKSNDQMPQTLLNRTAVHSTDIWEHIRGKTSVQYTKHLHCTRQHSNETNGQTIM